MQSINDSSGILPLNYAILIAVRISRGLTCHLGCSIFGRMQFSVRYVLGKFRIPFNLRIAGVSHARVVNETALRGGMCVIFDLCDVGRGIEWCVLCKSYASVLQKLRTLSWGCLSVSGDQCI